MAAKSSARKRRSSTPAITTTVKKAGGSLIVTVPAPARDLLQLSEGQEMSVSVEEGKLIYEAFTAEPRRRSKYTLDELLSQCDFDTPYSDEERAWLDAPPVGREII